MIASMPRAKLLSRINAGLFVVAHIVLVFGVRAAVDSFVGLVLGIMVGVLALWTWFTKRHLWTTPLAGVGFILFSVGGYFFFSNAIRPPPDPPALTFTRRPNGSYVFNRGGGYVVGRVYMVLPEREEQDSSPTILGAGRVVETLGLDTARIEWIVLRKRFRDRERYRVRPMRPNEKVPKSRSYATLIELDPPKGGYLDIGESTGVKVGTAYSLYHPGGAQLGGYFVVDRVEKERTHGYLVGASPSLPHDADLAGPVEKLVTLAMTRGEMAYLGKRIEVARKEFTKALELSGGTSELASDRLENIKQEKPGEKKEDSTTGRNTPG